MTVPYKRLPRPNAFGDYWFGSSRIPAEPAVFPSKEIYAEGVRATGTWLAFLGSARGFAYEGQNLKRFASPEEAMEYINEAMSKVPVSGAY